MAISDERSFTSQLYGFSFGLLFGYFIAGLYNAPSIILQEDFQKLGNLTGKTLEEITAVVGPYSEYSTCTITDMGNQPGSLYTWRKQSYSITLLFGADNKCISVQHESSQL